jgi:hypothetical protein
MPDGVAESLRSNGSLFVALGARFTQFLGAFFAADFNDMRSDFDLDGCRIEFVVTDGAGFLGHLSISLSARLSACSGDHLVAIAAIEIFRRFGWIA